MTQDKLAYIIPGILGPTDAELSSLLNIPLYAPYALTKKLMFNPSHEREILHDCGVNTPIGSKELHDTKHFLSNIFEFLNSYKNIKRWVFKITGEMGQRGLAYWDSSEFVKSKQYIQMTEKNRYMVLMTELQKSAVIVKPEIYNFKFKDYMKSLESHGGIIEAMPPVAYQDYELGLLKVKDGKSIPKPLIRHPSVHLILDPDAKITILGTVSFKHFLFSLV
jgi:hypothetical protein